MYNRYQSYDIAFGNGITPGIKTLLMVNVIVYLIQMVSLTYDGFLINFFGLTPLDITSSFFVWQLFSYMFLHGSLFHIAFNMLVLWMLGTEIERQWGTKEFYKFYFIAGIGAGLFNVIFQPTSQIPIIGASGAIYGVLIAFGMMFPERLILIYGIIPVKAKYLVLFLGVMAFVSAFSNAQDGIAHYTHLGGLVVGFLYLKYDWKIEKFSSKLRSKVKHPHLKMHKNPKSSDPNMRHRIDEILDKINQVGYENLTEEDKQILHKASEYLNKDR